MLGEWTQARAPVPPSWQRGLPTSGLPRGPQASGADPERPTDDGEPYRPADALLPALEDASIEHLGIPHEVLTDATTSPWPDAGTPWDSADCFTEDAPRTYEWGFSVTGCADHGLAGIDLIFARFMRENRVPNASFALLLGDGRLVMHRGYTYSEALREWFDCTGTTGADFEDNARATEIPLTTSCSRFRIASVSKVYTAVAILQLVEAGRLALTDRVVDYVGDISDAVHPEWVEEMRVWHLLCHVTGWDRGITEDPTKLDDTIAAWFSVDVPISRADIYRYVSEYDEGTGLRWSDAGRRFNELGFMQAQPATLQAYSNLGYFLAADIVERVTGVPLQSWVSATVLNPLGCRDTVWGRASVLGAHEMTAWSLESEAGCVATPMRQPLQRRVTRSPVSSTVAQAECAEAPYDRPNMEIRQGASAMVTTTLDLVRFGWELSCRSEPTVLSKPWRNLMKRNWVPSTAGGPWGLGVTTDFWGGGTAGVVGHTGVLSGNRAELCVLEPGYAGVASNPDLEGAVLAACINTNGTACTGTYTSLNAVLHDILGLSGPSWSATLPNMTISSGTRLSWPGCAQW